MLESSLEAHILKSDNSALAKDCRSEIKAANARLLKLTRKVAPSFPVCRRPWRQANGSGVKYVYELCGFGV